MLIQWFAVLLMSGCGAEYRNSYNLPPAPPLKCGCNEKPSKCRVMCPPQTCESIFTTYNCTGQDYCEPGCDCVDNYLRNKSGICVSSEKCFSVPECDVPIKCRPTCAAPNPPGCSYSPSRTNQDGCKCKQGYVLSDVGGQCIKVEECPANIGCNGDSNAYVKQFPQACPSTCDAPENYLFCKRKAEPLGCECKSGYIRSEHNGKCILPDKCPCGNPCGPNGTFVPCKFICPPSYCPQDDSRVKVLCKPPRPEDCPPGCICKLNYKFLSPENPICVRSDECPEVNCTRPFERWTSCPNECRSGYCEDAGKPEGQCNTLVLNCNPQCTCNDTFYRDPKTDMCVSTEECKEINKNQPREETESQ